jgi:hypothetical protein
MSASSPRFRLNAPGDFFVEDGCCISCTAPEHEAPELMAHDEDHPLAATADPLGGPLIYGVWFLGTPDGNETLERR